MSITTTRITNTEEAKKTHNLYDNYDNLVSVIKYDNNQNVDYVLVPDNNIAGKSVQTKKYQQVQVDIIQSPTDIGGDSATLRARIYKNENSKVYATGFIYWEGNSNETVIGKPEVINTFATPSVYKGNFSYNISNLNDNTTYNYRAFVRHEYGTNYSPVAQFTTISFTSIFSVIGQRYSAPVPFFVTLTAVNAGFGDYTYAWNLTSGNISFLYTLNEVNIALSGAGYTPKATNYALETIVVSPTGFGYYDTAKTNVLVNGIVFESLSANFQAETYSFGISSVTVPTALSGFKTNTLNITFSTSNDSGIVVAAIGQGTTSNYQVDRANAIFVDGTYQPSLSVVTVQDENTGNWGVSGVAMLEGPLSGYTTRTRTLLLSSNGPVTTSALISPVTSIQIVDADYYTGTNTVLNHTFLCAGNYNVKAYALLEGDIIAKSASRLVRATIGTDFTPQWTNIINAYGDNIAAAYDFRQWAGTRMLNEYPVGFYSFELEDLQEQYAVGRVGAGQTFIDTYSPGSESNIGGYVTLYSQSLPKNSVGGYYTTEQYRSILFGPGINGGRAARFDPSMVGGYGQSWVSGNQIFAFNQGQPFSLSMWVNPVQFEASVVGTKLFSVGPNVGWWNGLEFSITQSSTQLDIFKNLNAAQFSWEPIAGYRSGYPVLSTNDPAKMLDANTWNHLVITRGYNNDYKYYKNGILALSGTGHLGSVAGYNGGYTFNNLPMYQPSWNTVAGYCWFNIGQSRYFNTATGPFSGFMDAVGIWQKELTQIDVEDLYLGGNGTDALGHLNPVAGPKLYLGGLVSGSNRNNYFGQVRTYLDTNEDPYWDKVSLLLKFDGTNGSSNFTDSSVNQVPLSSSGAVINTSIKRFGTGAAVFSGANITGYIQTPSGSTWGNFARDDFTIEWWEYIDPSYSSGPINDNTRTIPVFFYGNPGNDTNAFPALGLYYQHYTGNNSFYARVMIRDEFGQDGEGRDFIVAERFDIFSNAGKWVHCALQRQNIGPTYASVFYYYCDGQLRGSSFGGTYSPHYIGLSGSNLSNNTILSGVNGTGSIGGGHLRIGGYGPGNNGYWRLFPGLIDDLRVTKGVGRYGRGGSNYSVPISGASTSLGTPIGTAFSVGGYAGSYAFTRFTVPVTIPHTLVFVGKTNATQTGNTVFQNIQPFKWFINSQNQQLVSECPIWLGLRPGPQFGTQPVAGYNLPSGTFRSSYTPTGVGGYGNEWMYIAYSFNGGSTPNNVRYFLKTPSVSGSGLISGYNFSTNFNGFPAFGGGGGDNPAGGYNNINGTVRLGMFMNRSFNESEMFTLFKQITAGPANDIQL